MSAETSKSSSAGYGRLRPWQAYLFAIVATVATIGFRHAIEAPLDGKTTLVLFILPIMLSAYLGGARGGLLATGLSFFWGGYHLLVLAHGVREVAGSSWWNLFFFGLSGVVISLLNDALHRARWQADLATQSHWEAEQQLKSALKDTNDLRSALDEHAIVAVTDPQGAITFVNEKFCGISKYERAELLGRDHRILNSAYHSERFIRDLWDTIIRGQVWQGEIKNRAKNGAEYWVATTIVPFLGLDGKPSQYVAIGTDISERKSAESAAAHLAAIVEHSDDAILGTDLQGIVTSWNVGAQKILGYLPEEMLGQSTMRFIPADRHAEEAEILERIGRGESQRDFETVRMRKDGSLVDLSVTISAIRDPSGKIVGASKVARDISVRKKAEETINRLNASLEERVIQRTAELEFANKELEAFSYSVSHDLRAPLRAIDGFSQAVLEDFGPQLPEEGQRYLRTIRQGAQQMGTLIDDLLTFSRFSRAPLNKQEVNTERLVRAVWEDLIPRENGRKIDLQIGTLPCCEADLALLREVWINLLSNAVKYTRKREVALVEIGCEVLSEGNAYFVRDNGTGFDMCYADKLFGVFQRLHLAEDYEGTGVGLALVQRIVHRHEGRVWAQAEIDHGATFYFTLWGNQNYDRK